MNCPIRSQENREWLLEYSAGRLDREHTQLIEQHVEACPACARFVEQQRVVWDALSQWESPEVSADFSRRLYQKIDQVQPSSWLQQLLRPLWRPMVPVAAACLLIVAGVALHSPSAGPNPALPRAEAVEPEQVERTLDDLQMLRELSLAPQPQEHSGTTQPM